MCDAKVSLSRSASKQEEAADEVCWICLSEGGPLERVCKCPSMNAHRACLARWQLQQAGRSEERFCRFCATELPDWREAHSTLPKASPIMTVVHNGVTHQVCVQPGPHGRDAFQAEIRRIFGLADSDAIQLTFGCKVPGTATAGHEITLEGWEAFDAAVHCAAISAGQRMARGGHLPAVPPPKQRPARRTSGVLRRLFSRTSSQQEAS